MQVETFRFMNVKCGGCVNTIRQGLLSEAGAHAVAVVIQGGGRRSEGVLTVNGEHLNRAALAQKLGQLGYPEVA